MVTITDSLDDAAFISVGVNIRHTLTFSVSAAGMVTHIGYDFTPSFLPTGLPGSSAEPPHPTALHVFCTTWSTLDTLSERFGVSMQSLDVCIIGMDAANMRGFMPRVVDHMPLMREADKVRFTYRPGWLRHPHQPVKVWIFGVHDKDMES